MVWNYLYLNNILINLYKIIIYFLDINECVSSPCQNGGNCNDKVNQYNCSCIQGFNGTHCEIGNYKIYTYTH